ncbi:hypothetical protein [Cyanobium sp. NIES-981]|uniref:hypothetical protein n=1 Tax=Cyanobium sp. NIES-981 TaxID=1851505 RepID=UPI000B35A816|nr:hypothetical protein [Cyanobium sp. NIES-981]
MEQPDTAGAGLGGTPQITPWSTTRLAGIIQNWARNPSYAALMDARLARQCLSQFWLMAPVDQLEALYRSPIGECYRQLLASGLARESLLTAESHWKDVLTHRLATAFERPETTNVLLAAMPYFPPGKMRVADPLNQVPAWLQEDYGRLFDPALLQAAWKPTGLLNPAGQSYGQAPRLGVQPAKARASAAPSAPSRPALPRLAKVRGAEALAAVQEPEFLNRMGGLINLHVIDPEDGQVLAQLIGLRRQLGQIWLDAQPAQLQDLYLSPFGQLYRDLLASGFSSIPLTQEDRLLRNQLARLVADMAQPGAINALMAVLPFYAPGSLAFGGGEQHMPSWLLQEIATIYGDRPDQDDAQPATGESPAM